MNDDRILKEIISFLDENNRLYPEDIINRETRLEEDLLLTGDDAAEFLDAFVKRFNIKDYSEFEFDDYFEAEGIDLFAIFRKKREKKVLTVGDLERAVETGILK